MADILKQQVLADRINKHYLKITQSERGKESPEQYLLTRLETLEIYWKDSYKLHWNILAKTEYATTDYVVKSLFDIIEEDYSATKAAILRELEKIRKSQVPILTTLPHQASPQQSQIQGNQLEWETFRDLFTAMVDKTKLSNVQKLYYLKTSLVGKAAERIKNLTVNEDNYDEAWSMLTRRYDNKRILLAAHMRKLLSCPAASKRSVDKILRLLDATNESIRAFTNMGRPVELWDDWFVHLLVHKLDPHTREEWETSLRDSSSEEFPNFDDLSSFLESTVRALEASHPIPTSPTNTPKPQTAKGRKSTISVNLSQTDSTPSPSKLCPLCQSAHFISYCPQFKKLKESQRLEQVKRLKLCFNCLRGNHNLENCPSQKRCFVYGSNHHTFIHDGLHATPNSKTVEPSSGTSSSEQIACHISYQNNHLCDQLEKHSKCIFATAYIKLTSFNGKSVIVKGFLESGSEHTLITERVAQLLKLPKLKCEVSLKGISNSSLGSSNYKVNLWLQSPKDSEFRLPLNALILKSLIQLIPKSKPKHTDWQHLKDLELADPTYHLAEPIDCVLGIDLFGHVLLPGLKQGPLDSPTALLTTFGWIIFGGSLSINDDESSSHVLHAEERDSLNQQLRSFWELEELPKRIFPTNEEIMCKEFFLNTHYRDQKGQFVVQLPLAQSRNLLGRSKEAVISMFKRNEAQLSKDPNAKAKHNSFMEEYLSLNHMKLVSQEDQSFPNPNYLLHHVITKAHDPSSKIRVVFNGSFRTTSNVSLNDILHPGQKLQPDIWLIISRWRFWKYVFTADIFKMFRQIKILSPDCNLQRIVWRADPSQPLREYNLTTVTYGTKSAPFLAIRVLHQLANDERDRFPLGAHVLNENIYVDDIFSGANTLECAINIRSDLVNILTSADITLSKWAANNSSLLPENSSEKIKTEKVFDLENSVSTLGLRWNQSTDEFHFAIIPISSSNPTKRVVASEIAKLFDPLGWLSPFLLTAKILLQDCWLAGNGWDDVLPDNLLVKWNEFQEQFNQLYTIRIPRWIQTSDDQSTWELHGFADASERAYSAALFLVDRSLGDAHSHLLISKTKLAPVKVISLPKLELCAAHLLVKLSVTLIDKLLPSIKTVYYWSDSQIVLSWLQGHPSRWKPFIANRVSEIHTLSKDASWSHVRSEHNPADYATRGFTVNELRDSKLWWNGPQWLLEDPEFWPISKLVTNPKCFDELRPKFLPQEVNVQINLVQDEPPDLLSRVSSLTKLVRITVYCLRFIKRLKNRNLDLPNYLTVGKLKEALDVWIKLVQTEYFSSVINTLKSNRNLSSKDPMIKLAPYLDQNSLLRLKGRLENGFLSYDEKHPIILPKKSRLSELIVLHSHKETLHGGQQLTLSKVLRKFWIISAKSLINRVLRGCVRCARFRAITPTQLMGQLPAERVTVSKPFTFAGLDYAGPFQVLTSKGRGNKSTKGYICLFVCLCTRAIHLELVSDYETSTFLAAFKRFISRRGQCSKVISDNARNFVGAERELKALFTGTTNIFPEVTESLANQGTAWSFIPPQAPHFGEIWEVGVKSVKYHLRRIIGETRLTFEEMTTVLCQIEACLNSRPLYPNTSDVHSVSAITPGHILTGGPMVAIPEPNLVETTLPPANRWKLLTKMRDDFWTRWSQEYLHHLQQRSKWLIETNVVKVGDVVLFKEDNQPPTQWLLGRIDVLHPGRDGLSRVATVKTATSSYKRPFSKLALLPIITSNDDD